MDETKRLTEVRSTDAHCETYNPNVSPLHIANGKFYDSLDREVMLRGINFAGEAKFPAKSDSDSYVGSPMPLEEADQHLQRLRNMGYNCIRYLYTWDAIEHKGPGQYDDEFIEYTIEMLKKIRSYGFYVFLDPHQDTWSRFSGGSGAPYWTLLAAGFDPEEFERTHAAVLYHKHHKERIKMLWSSNYHRLVCQTMFTLFFGGESFAPQCKINGQFVGDYLQKHFIASVRYLCQAVFNADLGPCILGFESMNEPDSGLIGYDHLDSFPNNAGFVKLGSAPTPFQAMLLGKGIKQKVDWCRFTMLGIRKEDEVVIEPRKPVWLDKAQLSDIDRKYGWERSWRGGCIWELHGVYNSETQTLVAPKYFKHKTQPSQDNSSFVEIYFPRFWQRFENVIESINPDWFRFMQTPVNCAPPNFVEMNARGSYSLDLEKTVYTPHFYDGLTLMMKKWRAINVDSVGVCRNQYVSPVLAVRMGSKGIRSCFEQQLLFIKQEGLARVGTVPCLISEFGVPMDLDSKRAYYTGYYEDQIRALDANHNAMDNAKLHYTLWVYCWKNTHELGDNWNGEDLSIFSIDDMEDGDDCNMEGYNNTSGLKDGRSTEHLQPANLDGIRATPAVVRPHPIAVCGDLISYNFDIYVPRFSMSIEAPATKITREKITKISVPAYYFGDEPAKVEVSSGHYFIKDSILHWVHRSGPQSIIIWGTPRFADSLFSYFDTVAKVTTGFVKDIKTLFGVEKHSARKSDQK